MICIKPCLKLYLSLVWK